MPALLPKEGQRFAEVEDDNTLFQQLKKNPEELVYFFQYACDDETWSEQHAPFMREAIEWLTERFFADKLLMAMARKAATAIREHYFVLRPFVPNNLTIIAHDVEMPVNSLLFGAASEFLREMIRRECRDNKTEKLTLMDTSAELLGCVEEFVNTGTVKELWRKEAHAVLAVLRLAAEWELQGLMLLCEDILSRYITEANAIDYLLMAYEELWQHLKAACIDFINRRDVGVYLAAPGPAFLSLEFTNFREDALEIFESLHLYLTHIICGKHLTEEPPFSEIINRCPHLICLDISQTDTFSSRLLDIPETLEELDISKCIWLTDKNLPKLVEICPNLKKLSLGRNAQISYAGWGVLRGWAGLEKVDIDSSFTVEDEEFNVILQTCRHVTHLGLAGCTGLSDHAFQDLAATVPHLTDLDLSRCNISDGTLIELCVHCQQLISLNLTRCPSLTEKGIVEVVRNANNLRKLDLTRCRIPPLALEQIREISPFLEVIS